MIGARLADLRNWNNQTQEELARRMSREPNSTKTATTATGKYSRYALSNVMICAECGSRYKRVTWTSRGKKRVVWRCISRLEITHAEVPCENRTVNELLLQEITVKVYYPNEDGTKLVAVSRKVKIDQVRDLIRPRLQHLHEQVLRGSHRLHHPRQRARWMCPLRFQSCLDQRAIPDVLTYVPYKFLLNYIVSL